MNPHSKTHYHKRKAEGLCVRCAVPAYRHPSGRLSPLCYQHMREKQSIKPREVSMDYDALPGEPEPPRPKYLADYMRNLPELPDQCPRCKAQLLPYQMEIDSDYLPAVICVNCSFQVDQLAWKNKLEAA